MKRKLLLLIISLLVLLSVTACTLILPGSRDDVRTPAPSLEELLEKNATSSILATYGNVTLNTTFSSEEKTSTKEQRFFKSGMEIVSDLRTEENGVTTLISERGEVSYLLSGDELSLMIDLAHSDTLGFFESVGEPKLIGKIYEEDECWVATLWSRSNDADDASGCYYTIWFDASTLYAKRATISLIQGDLTPSIVAETLFTYGEEASGLSDSAFSRHASLNSPIDLSIIVDPGLDREKTVEVKTDKTSDISVIGEDLTEYTVFADFDDKLGITDLTSIDGNDATVYAILGREAISFECNFSANFVEEAKARISDLKAAGLATDTVIFDKVLSDVLYNHDYANSQLICYQIAYYLTPNEENAAAYSFVEQSIIDLVAMYNDTIKELYNTSPIKDHIFAGYTEEELDKLNKDNSTIAEIEKKISDLTIEYQMLNYYSPTWADEVDEIFLEIAKLNNEKAKLNGYDNFYDFAAETYYSRYYTEEQRAAFRSYVREYIVPLHVKSRIYNSYYSNMCDSDVFVEYYTFYYGQYSDDEEVQSAVMDYINSYTGYGIQDKMLSAFEDEAVVFATDMNSLGTAFAAWDYVYQHSLAYFGYFNQGPFSVIHELGHYSSFYHYDFDSICYDVAETHSQANEWIFAFHLKNIMSEMTWNCIITDKASEDLGLLIRATLVDEFEETFYKALAENPDMMLDEMRAYLDDISSSYEHDSGYGVNADDGADYIRRVVVENPVYYFNYAPSQVASIGFACIASEEGLDAAREKFVYLLEGVDTTLPFMDIVSEVGMLDPFAEETFVKIVDLFIRPEVDFDRGRQDSIFAEAHEIEELFTLSESNGALNFDEDGRVLMIYFTNNEGEYMYTDIYGSEWSDLRMVSADELMLWYAENSDGVNDWNKRLSELFGFNEKESVLGFIGMWVDIEDLYRLAYQSDVTKQLSPTDLICDENGNYPSIDDEIEDVFISLRKNALLSGTSSICTMLGYTYDIGNNEDYGLSEFMLKLSSPYETVFSFDCAEGLIEWLEGAAA